MFPDILDFLSTDPATPWLHYAVVLNGKLQATNSKMACYIDVSTFIEDETQIKAIEGKAFDSEDIITMRDSRIRFTKKSYSIIGFDIEVDYSAVIGQNREISLYDDLMDEYVPEKTFKKFPDFTTVIPAFTDGDIDVVKVQKRNSHFRGVGVGVPQMVAISKAFQQSREELFNLRFDFFHANKEKDKVDKVSAPILVTPFKTKFPLYKEAAIINPVS